MAANDPKRKSLPATGHDEGAHGLENRDDGRSRPENRASILTILAALGSAARMWRQHDARQSKVDLAPRRVCAHRVSQVLGEMKTRVSGGNYE